MRNIHLFGYAKEVLSWQGRSFDPGIEAFEDWDVYLRFALKYEIGSIPESLVRIRIHRAHSTQGEFTRGVSAYR